MAGRVTRLTGGITATVERVETEDGSVLVRKRYAAGDPEAAALVARDAAALRALAYAGIPVPRLLRAEPEGDESGAPAIVMTFLPGEPRIAAPDPQTLAAMHARMHALPPVLAAEMNGWFDASQDFGWFADAGLRRAALAAVSGSDVDPVFVHGDYQPFNVLYAGDAISGVVDWTMAGTGSRGVDVGHCLLNLAVLVGPDAADAYLAAYERAAGVTPDAGSLLRALLSWNRDWERSIPIQVAGRAGVDIGGMADRVSETIRRRLG